MITFAYQARDASGRIVSGIQDALNEDNAVTSLMSRGLMVLSLQKKAVAGCSRKKTWTVKETDLVLFTRHLATMIDAGISLVQGLTVLYDQSDPKRQRSLRHAVSDVTTRVQSGETFHESIAKHPRVFNRLFVSMVKAGESGGLLAEILERLAGFLETSARLRKKVKSAMTYPVIVVCIAFAITTFLIVRVVPIFGRFIFIDNRLSRGLQTRLDLAQYRQNFGRVRLARQDHFALVKRRCVRAGVEICFRQLPRSPERLIVTPDFGVGLPQNLERLIILGLCSSDRLKHLDRLEDLGMLLGRKRVFQHVAL
jgi:type IV pilus assembly protein PilC